MEEVVGFTEKQRRWFIEMAGGQCEAYHFNILKFKWERCKNRNRLQVHHIIPRGWAKLHMPKNFNLNGAMNGIVLCELGCHCGSRGVHPDVAEAHEKYRKGHHQAFDEMMKKRAELNRKGIPYWSTRYDFLYSRIARKRTLRVIKAHPYPANGNRGNTGRI